MNMKNSILLLDPEFDPNSAPNCNLLLKITNDSFSYAIINQDNKRLKAVFDEQECDNITQTIKNNLKNDPYLKHPFKTVKIAISTPNCVTVPNILFDEADLNAYSNFFAEKNSQRIYTRQNNHFDYTAVFNLQQALEQELDAQFENADKYEHGLALAKMAESIEHGMCFDFTARSVSVIYINQGSLSYKNTFETENAEEFNYYLLLMIIQLDIDTKQTPALMSGIINEGDEKHQTLKKYFSNTIFNTPSNQELDCTILEDMPTYYYSNLLAIDLCV